MGWCRHPVPRRSNPGDLASDRKVHTFSVWLASPPNAAPREYTPAPFALEGWTSPNYLQFSPDGRQLLLSDYTDAGECALWLLSFPDGGRAPHRIFPKVPRIRPQLTPTQLSWMPDSRRAVMVFPTPSSPKGGLWMTDVQTGDDDASGGGADGAEQPQHVPEG